MRNTVESAAETIPVGTGRDDVRVLLIVTSKTETIVCVMIAASAKNNDEAKNKAEEVRCQEVPCLRKTGYGEAGKPMQMEIKTGGEIFIATKYVFQWTDWKYKTMKMVKPT